MQFLEVTHDDQTFWYNATEIVMLRDNPNEGTCTVWLRDGTVLDYYGSVYTLKYNLEDQPVPAPNPNNIFGGFTFTTSTGTSTNDVWSFDTLGQ